MCISTIYSTPRVLELRLCPPFPPHFLLLLQLGLYQYLEPVAHLHLHLSTAVPYRITLTPWRRAWHVTINHSACATQRYGKHHVTPYSSVISQHTPVLPCLPQKKKKKPYNHHCTTHRNNTFQHNTTTTLVCSPTIKLFVLLLFFVSFFITLTSLSSHVVPNFKRNLGNVLCLTLNEIWLFFYCTSFVHYTM